METEEHKQNLQEEALQAIEQLVNYSLERGLLKQWDVDYGRNRLLELFSFDEPFVGEVEHSLPKGPQLMLNMLIDYGFEIGLIPDNTDTYRDLLDARIMGLLTPRPSEIIEEFWTTAKERGIQTATAEFCQLSIDSNYIRMDRISKNIYWKQDSSYGDMEITINLSKPEKNPKEIAMAKLLPPPVYPKCQLCRENVGYAGRVNHPARQNLRTIPLQLDGETWFFQYSPYVYYDEHCIVFHHDHVPMKLTRDTFRRLLQFVEQFPHYFIGSNADLPIVGGSILTHDHFQGGHHSFPLDQAPIEQVFTHSLYDGVTLGIVKWPMSVLRLSGQDRDVLLEAADDVYEKWKQYSDPEADIHAFTEEDGVLVPHNTVTPIVRRGADGGYEMDIVLRNNLTSEQHPDGIFHPHREMHHIKKENIGLIEVMGLAILPGRLTEELQLISDIMTGDDSLLQQVKQGTVASLVSHTDWITTLVERHGTSLTEESATALLRDEVGTKFAQILEHAGVYKRTPSGQESFTRFVQHVGYRS